MPRKWVIQVLGRNWSSAGTEKYSEYRGNEWFYTETERIFWSWKRDWPGFISTSPWLPSDWFPVTPPTAPPQSFQSFSLSLSLSLSLHFLPFFVFPVSPSFYLLAYSISIYAWPRLIASVYIYDLIPWLSLSPIHPEFSHSDLPRPSLLPYILPFVLLLY